MKSCCAALYQSDFARLLLGDSFHPGGNGLPPGWENCWASAPLFAFLSGQLARARARFSLPDSLAAEVVGVDFGAQNVREAELRVPQRASCHLVSFVEGDAEGLDFPDAGFDAVICECAFCTFPDNAPLPPGSPHSAPGRPVGMSDLTRSGHCLSGPRRPLSWIACIADARPVDEYAAIWKRPDLK